MNPTAQTCITGFTNEEPPAWIVVGNHDVVEVLAVTVETDVVPETVETDVVAVEVTVETAVVVTTLFPPRVVA